MLVCKILSASQLFTGNIYFFNLLGKRFQKNLGWEDPGVLFSWTNDINWKEFKCLVKVSEKQETLTSIVYCLSTIPIACMVRGQFLFLKELVQDFESTLILKKFTKGNHVETYRIKFLKKLLGNSWVLEYIKLLSWLVFVLMLHWSFFFLFSLKNWIYDKRWWIYIRIISFSH